MDTTDKKTKKPLRQQLFVPLPDEYPAHPVDSAALLRDRRDWELTKWDFFSKGVFWGTIISGFIAYLILS